MFLSFILHNKSTYKTFTFSAYLICIYKIIILRLFVETKETNKIMKRNISSRLGPNSRNRKGIYFSYCRDPLHISITGFIYSISFFSHFYFTISNFPELFLIFQRSPPFLLFYSLPFFIA